MKLYDFNRNKIKKINHDNDKTLFIDVYYDELHSDIYIIYCSFNYVKSYNYYKNELYHKYYDNDNEGHLSAKIYINKGKTKLIESCIDGNIRIWDFHSGLLLNKIKVAYENLYGLCLWNENHLFVACGGEKIKLVDLKNGIVIKNILGHKMEVLTIKKFIHPLYGECLISQGLSNDKIKLLINNNNYLYY